MASLIQASKIQVGCSCGFFWPISNLYFCKHCLNLRCWNCVCHEVDSHFCPSCLENMPSAEAKLKKNRCANCYVCPSCKRTLSTRATSIATPNPDDPDKPTVKKVYYLACSFCRWTSRDVGMPDQSVAGGGSEWQDEESPNAKRLAELFEYYHQLARRDKLEREKKKYIRRRNYLHLQEKYFSNPGRRKGAAILTALSSLSVRDNEPIVSIKAPASQTAEEIEELPEDIFTKPLVLESICTLEQRMTQPELQPSSIKSLLPRHQHLLIKRSQRCKECEHNLSKPEFNPSSIKFKIQLIALHHVPELRLLSVPNLYYSETSVVTLSLINPVENITQLRLEAANGVHGTSAKIEVPSEELVLGAKDATADFDDVADTEQFQDDPKVIHFRKANKLGVFVKVTPLRPLGNVVVSLRVHYSYRNLAVTASPKKTAAGPETGGDSPQQQQQQQQPQQAVTWLHYDTTVELGPVAK